MLPGASAFGRCLPLIPTNLITGFLGVGKTTAVIDLLKRKSSAERWAVLVNEFGEVGIDEALIEGAAPAEGVTVREIAGGCVCCATAPHLPVALHFLLQESRPDRLIVETTGLGHPARLLEFLRGPAYAGRLDVRATLGLVAPVDVASPGMFDNPVFRDQAHLADVLVLNKRDRATPDVLARFADWANGLYPPKLLVAVTEQGRLDPAWLDLTADHERRPQFPEDHAHAEPVTVPLLTRPRPNRPTRYPSPSGSACGWLFHPDDVFDEDRLLVALARPGIARLKGVFHVAGEWIAVNRSANETAVTASAYRRDSRLEVFASDESVDWTEWETDLVNCLA